jgi:hypothetical protein
MIGLQSGAGIAFGGDSHTGMRSRIIAIDDQDSVDWITFCDL